LEEGLGKIGGAGFFPPMPVPARIFDHPTDAYNGFSRAGIFWIKSVGGKKGRPVTDLGTSSAQPQPHVPPRYFVVGHRTLSAGTWLPGRSAPKGVHVIRHRDISC
jgi:hypothetical protein